VNTDFLTVFGYYANDSTVSLVVILFEVSFVTLLYVAINIRAAYRRFVARPSNHDCCYDCKMGS
jgi:hypothetical protein